MLYLIALNRKVYERNILTGFIITEYTYNKSNYTCSANTAFILKDNLYKGIKENRVIPLNFRIGKNRLTTIKFQTTLEKVTHFVKAVRVYMERTYGRGTDLAGHCIEASEYIKQILLSFGILGVETVEGWCQYDDEYYGSDRPYGEHTWVEINHKCYIDVTADQFNPGMYKENEYNPIIIQRGLPHGMRYTEPVEGTDYWIDC